MLYTISISFLAIASLMVTNAFINTSLGLGNKVGDYIALTSQQELSPEGIARGTAKEYSSVGLVVFGTWVMMVGLLVSWCIVGMFMGATLNRCVQLFY